MFRASSIYLQTFFFSLLVFLGSAAYPAGTFVAALATDHGQALLSEPLLDAAALPAQQWLHPHSISQRRLHSSSSLRHGGGEQGIEVGAQTAEAGVGGDRSTGGSSVSDGGACDLEMAFTLTQADAARVWATVDLVNYQEAPVSHFQTLWRFAGRARDASLVAISGASLVAPGVAGAPMRVVDSGAAAGSLLGGGGSVSYDALVRMPTSGPGAVAITDVDINGLACHNFQDRASPPSTHADAVRLPREGRCPPAFMASAAAAAQQLQRQLPGAPAAAPGLVAAASLNASSAGAPPPAAAAACKLAFCCLRGRGRASVGARGPPPSGGSSTVGRGGSMLPGLVAAGGSSRDGSGPLALRGSREDEQPLGSLRAGRAATALGAGSGGADGEELSRRGSNADADSSSAAGDGDGHSGGGGGDRSDAGGGSEHNDAQGQQQRTAATQDVHPAVNSPPPPFQGAAVDIDSALTTAPAAAETSSPGNSGSNTPSSSSSNHSSSSATTITAATGGASASLSPGVLGGIAAAGSLASLAVVWCTLMAARRRHRCRMRLAIREKCLASGSGSGSGSTHCGAGARTSNRLADSAEGSPGHQVREQQQQQQQQQQHLCEQQQQQRPSQLCHQTHPLAASVLSHHARPPPLVGDRRLLLAGGPRGTVAVLLPRSASAASSVSLSAGGPSQLLPPSSAGGTPRAMAGGGAGGGGGEAGGSGTGGEARDSFLPLRRAITAPAAQVLNAAMAAAAHGYYDAGGGPGSTLLKWDSGGGLVSVSVRDVGDGGDQRAGREDRGMPLQLHAPGSPASPGLPEVDFERDVALGRKIGSGGFGTVYKGLWRGEPVAVKVYHWHGSPTDLESFRQEVKVLSRLRHPNIVGLKAICAAPPHVCMLVELAEGGSLYGLLHGERGTLVRPLPLPRLMRIARDVADALSYLHPTVVHRDLKPQNVLLGADGRAMVCDFGVAKLKDRTFISSTEGGAQAGTPAYMAPELFEGVRATEKIDTYSFGLLLWEGMTGRLPWRELSHQMQVIYAVSVLQQRPPIPAGCPDSLARLITRCWDADPDQRPSFPEICAALQAMQAEDWAKESHG